MPVFITIRRKLPFLSLAALLLGTSGCGSFMARRMAQAPNTYPAWFAPAAPVELNFSPKMLTNFPAHYVEVGPPAARLRYRVVEPADYHFKVSSTNWLARGRREFDYTFHADVPGATNGWTAAPRGTVVLLHGFGLAQFSMAPWAVRLAEHGWRCVLVDLRGHGKSTGRRIYFGLQETQDLSRLLDELARKDRLQAPVSVMGESYGAALALRWAGVEPRVRAVVAIAPYAELNRAALNIAREYAGWMPRAFVKAGLRELPPLLQVSPDELNTSTVLARHPVSALFVAGAEDRIMAVDDITRLRNLARPDSKLIVVPQATHESVTYFFDALDQPVSQWLGAATGK